MAHQFLKVSVISTQHCENVVPKVYLVKLNITNKMAGQKPIELPLTWFSFFFEA